MLIQDLSYSVTTLINLFCFILHYCLSFQFASFWLIMQNTILIINGHLLYPFKARYVFFKKILNFFQTLAYMLIWSSKVVTWVWFLAWAILLAKNNARSWKVAHFSQVELITCFHEFWNYESMLFSRNFICFVFLRYRNFYLR